MLQSVESARQQIIDHAKILVPEELPLAFASGRFSAAEYPAPYPHPFFDQSAMDGYAIRAADSGEAVRLRVIGEVRAGDDGNVAIEAGEAVRIFTGAPVPSSADTIVIQENVEREGDEIILSGTVPAGAHIRKKGEQLAEGDVAVAKGAALNAANIGLLATFGESHISSPRQPIVAILSTGSEFAKGKDDLAEGRIFESNGVMLRTALQKMGLESFHAQVDDDPAEILKRVENAAMMSDVLITTGGVSVGAHDHTRDSLEKAGYEVIFHRVNQKPGKPLLFAHKRPGRAAFGLPGNPRSALIGFYMYVYPYLRRVMGAHNVQLPSLELPLVHDYHKKDGKTHFVAGAFAEQGLQILGGQNSHMLASLAAANLIAEIPAESTHLTAGTKLKAYILPQ